MLEQWTQLLHTAVRTHGNVCTSRGVAHAVVCHGSKASKQKSEMDGSKVLISSLWTTKTKKENVSKCSEASKPFCAIAQGTKHCFGISTVWATKYASTPVSYNALRFLGARDSGSLYYNEGVSWLFPTWGSPLSILGLNHKYMVHIRYVNSPHGLLEIGSCALVTTLHDKQMFRVRTQIMGNET